LENIKKRLLKIRSAITAAEKKYRTPGVVTLVAVSKSQPVEKIKAAIADNQKDFGESYLQEAMIKINELKRFDIIWHYIGKIQSKKTKLIAQNFAWVESVVNYEIAELLDKYRPPNMSPLNICIQVNISKEASKAGVLLEEILPLAKKIIKLPKLQLRGLMAIPSYQESFAEQFTTFNTLALELKKLQQHKILVDTLSMGMSDDYEAAIAAGATIVRIGTAIFGERITKNKS
jgi:PLP dependent protein